ncbi:MAG: hypothetical protein R3192_10345 [Woeseiaceae bacterium]|nr:hypothetical protein [Woeseiaceae bacterium]
MIDATDTTVAAGQTVLYVHGRHFKPPQEDLQGICLAAMQAGVQRDYPEMADAFAAIRKDIAYYGDISNAFLETRGESYDAGLDVGDRRNALQMLSAIKKAQKFGIGPYDRLPGKTALAEFAADFSAPVLGFLGLTEKVIAKVFPDLAEYWNKDSDFGSRIRERVRTALCNAMQDSERLMLISHGTGCIVAYDVLWQLSHDDRYCELLGDGKLDAWVTLGAPLGDQTIKKKLFGSGNKGSGQYPSNIVSWYNVSAEDDYVCHDNTLADDFAPMLRKHLISTIKDFRVYNLAVRYGKSNPHSSVGYLIHPRVTQILVEWLRQGENLQAATNSP